MAFKHYFNFISSNHRTVEIDEPFGWDGVGFTISTAEGRKGRDVFYSGSGEAQYTINSHTANPYGYYFDWVMLNWRRYGHQAKIQYMVDFGNGITVLGNFDMSAFETDGYNFASISVVQENSKFKENYEVPTDLNSEIDTFGNPIVKPVRQRMLLKAKPTVQSSEWDNPTPNEFLVFSDSDLGTPDYFNVIKNSVKYDIKRSLGLWRTDRVNALDGAGDTFRYIQAATNLTNLTIQFDLNVIFQYRPTLNNSLPNHRGQLKLNMKYGQDYDSATLVNIWASPMYEGNTNADIQMPTQLFATIPFLNETDYLWIYWTAAHRNGATSNTIFNECKISISAISTAKNTVTPAYRYIDAMRYAVKSASSKDIVAPFYDVNGEYYDQFLLTSQMMRLIADKPVNLSCKDFIEDHVQPETDGDYQLQGDLVYIEGKYREFYRDVSIGAYPEMQLEGYNEKSNPKYACNQFKLGFKSYAAQKESETPDTLDLVHGESTWKIQNESVNNVREASIGFVRDPNLIEEQRRKALDITDNTATQDDGKFFLIDIVPLPAGTNFTETSALQHQVSGTDVNLINDGSFSWLQLGIVINLTFTITNTDNAQYYLVVGVSDKKLELHYFGVIPFEPVNILLENTTFKYNVDPSVIYTNRTNEGFELIDNIVNPDNYGNLRHTVGRLIRNYYHEELATNVMYSRDKQVRNTVYKYNPTATTKYAPEFETIVEGALFEPKGAILTPKLIETHLIMSFQEFWRLSQVLITERGYIDTFNPSRLPIKGYIKEGTWLPLTKGAQTPEGFLGVFECTLEEKYQEFYLNIYADGMVFIMNGDIQPNSIHFTIDGNGYVYIYDVTGLLLFPAVDYDRVQINNSGSFINPDDLGQALMQYAVRI